jgi:hypothetical protein
MPNGSSVLVLWYKYRVHCIYSALYWLDACSELLVMCVLRQNTTWPVYCIYSTLYWLMLCVLQVAAASRHHMACLLYLQYIVLAHVVRPAGCCSIKTPHGRSVVV